MLTNWLRHIVPRIGWGVAALMLNIAAFWVASNTVLIESDTYLYEQHEANMHRSLVMVQDVMQSNKNNLPRALSTLETALDTQSIILEKNAENYPKELLLLFDLPENQLGYLEVDTGTVYYPLARERMLELGPIIYDFPWYYSSEFLLWMLAALLNALLVAAWWKQQKRTQYFSQQHTLNQLRELNVPFQQGASIEQCLQQIQWFLNKQSTDTQQRILLQRDLLHGVAHEFRSPMARMQFALDMLEDAAEAERQDLHDSLNASLTDLDDLVKELLYYARLKDSESSLKLTQVALLPVIEKAMHKVMPFYANVRFELTPDAAQTHAEVMADSNLLHRLFTNILRNAGRFASTRCVVHIQQANKMWRILIEDDGIGIPPGKQARIFEPFTRLDPSRSRDSGGCGLGLAIAASIVDKHHGNIQVINPENRLGGACFEISLPCC